MKKIFAWIEKNPLIAGIIIIGAAWLLMTMFSGPAKQRRAHNRGTSAQAGAAASSGATGGMDTSSTDTSAGP